MKNRNVRSMQNVHEVIKKIFCLYILLFIYGFSFSQQLAFPGAEGFGKFTSGGRGGIVIEVTNLKDSGTGSLRDALTNSLYKGKKRTIVFKVSGTIDLLSQIQVKYDSCITIAGQTAPGDGICIRNFPISLSDSKNIIIRYLRSRLGDLQTCDSALGECDIDAFSIRKCHHIMLDHCSFSWSIDDVLDLTVETGYTTVQYCILSEALNNSKHSKGAHGYAAGWDGYSYGDYGVFAGSTYHHNLIASCNSRTPRLDSYAGENNTGRRDLLDIVNNVIYNWNSNGAYGGENADVNWQNNYYKYGPNTSKKDQIFQPDQMCKIFLAGNYVDGYPAVTVDNSLGIYVAGKKATTAQLDTILKPVSFDVWPVNMETSQNAYATILESVGAVLPKRDEVDKRILNDVVSRTGAIINSQSEVGEWPVLYSVTAPADTDHDGMPDEWETKAGLNPNNAADRNGDVNSNGYTDLEDYLNGININATNSDELYKNNSERICRIFPNPITSQTIIELNSLEKTNMELAVFDISGKYIQTLYKGLIMPGLLTIPWDVKQNVLTPGIYICQISVGNSFYYKKIMIPVL
jgi:hypothetical protein